MQFHLQTLYSTVCGGMVMVVTSRGRHDIFRDTFPVCAWGDRIARSKTALPVLVEAVLTVSEPSRWSLVSGRS
jgi:hypothetical protein